MPGLRKNEPVTAGEASRAQTIRIRPDGTIEIAWISPPATDLVLALMKEAREEAATAVTPLFGNLYCG